MNHWGFEMFSNWLSNRRGNTTVVFALCLPVVMGCAGLGVEVGFWQYRQREAQTAADLAAYAGAVSLRGHRRESDDQKKPLSLSKRQAATNKLPAVAAKASEPRFVDGVPLTGPAQADAMAGARPGAPE